MRPLQSQFKVVRIWFYSWGKVKTQLSIAAQDTVGLCGVGHTLKRFTAKAMGDFCECHPLPISEPQRRLELSFENPVFGSNILIDAKGVPDSLSQ